MYVNVITLIPILYTINYGSIMTSLIDNETSIKKVLSHHDKRTLHLVMSDEYNIEGRDFGFGKDNIFEVTLTLTCYYGRVLKLANLVFKCHHIH